MNTVEKGRKGETLAENYFKERGFSVIQRNYRRGRGEIDLILRKESDLVFVEVKYWTSLSSEDMEYGIGIEKKRRILSTSKLFLLENPEYDGSGIRYDVLFIPESAQDVVHLEDAFREDF
jgi:putative endonuclease